MDSLDLYVGGRAGEIDVTAFAEALAETAKLLRSVSDEDIECTIGNLKIGSAEAAVLAPERAVNLVVSGLNQINTEATLPTGWSNRSLTIVERIGKVLNRRGVSSLSMGQGKNLVAFEVDFLERVHEAKADNRNALGSVVGRIYSYSNRHGEIRASLEDAKTNRSVKILLDHELGSQVSKLIDQDVVAFGLLTRRPEDNTVQEIELRDIRILEPRRIPGDISKFRGTLQDDWPCDLDPVEAVRLHRDA